MLAALLQHTGRANVSLLLEEAHFGPLCFDTKRHSVQSFEQLDSVTARELKTEVQGPAVTQFTVPQYLIHRSQASRLTARRVAIHTGSFCLSS